LETGALAGVGTVTVAGKILIRMTKATKATKEISAPLVPGVFPARRVHKGVQVSTEVLVDQAIAVLRASMALVELLVQEVSPVPRATTAVKAFPARPAPMALPARTALMAAPAFPEQLAAKAHAACQAKTAKLLSLTSFTVT